MLEPTDTAIRKAALSYLSHRDYSVHEITMKLTQKGYAADCIAITVESLTEAGYLNDQRFTENYIHWQRRKGIGPLRIKAALENRGIPSEIIAQYLNITDNVWHIEARNLWQKHFKGKSPSDFKSRAKQMRFLQYRGFSLAQITCLLNESYGHEEESIES